MTSAIRLSLAGDEGIPLVARVYSDNLAAWPTVEVKEVVIPSVGDIAIDVPPGSYAVSLFLPTGRILSRRCQVADHEEAVVFDTRELSGKPSRGARFSLQEAIAEVDPQRLAARISAMIAADSSVGSTTRQRPAPASPKGSRGGFGVAGGRKTAEAERGGAAQAEKVLPVVSLMHGFFEGDAAWSCLSGHPQDWKGTVERIAPVSATDRSLWTIEGLPAGAARAWVKTEARAGIEISALPLPWRTDEATPVSVSVDPRIEGRAMTDMAVRDDAMGGLLAYLEQGRLSLMGPLLQGLEEDGTIERAVASEVPAPLAACAAAFAFLATFTAGRAHRWSGWLEKLVECHPGIPDCAVALARLRILMPGSATTSAAAEPLLMAFRAGVPYFSPALLIMRDMLVSGSADDPEQKRMLDAVAPVVARCDPFRLFTILRYPRI